MLPDFSVIIPLYNKEKYITDTLKSVLNQSFKNYEVVIINDGSTDNSYSVAQEFIKKNKLKATLLTQKNKGLSATRNNAIKVSKGKIIALLDADDEWLPSYLEEIHKLYKKFPESCFFGTDYIEYYDDNNVFEPKKTLPKTLKNSTFIVEDFFQYNLGQPILCPSSLTFTKEAFTLFKFDESINYSEDIDFYIRVFKKHKLAYSYKPLAKLRLNVPNQMTSTGVINKKITNLNKYETDAKTNPSLKKYLDFYRYFYASEYKYFGDLKNFRFQIKNIDYNSLNWKQKLILKMPRFLSKNLISLKRNLLKFNIKWSSYSF